LGSAGRWEDLAAALGGGCNGDSTGHVLGAIEAKLNRLLELCGGEAPPPAAVAELYFQALQTQEHPPIDAYYLPHDLL